MTFDIFQKKNENDRNDSTVKVFYWRGLLMSFTAMFIFHFTNKR